MSTIILNFSQYDIDDFRRLLAINIRSKQFESIQFIYDFFMKISDENIEWSNDKYEELLKNTPSKGTSEYIKSYVFEIFELNRWVDMHDIYVEPILETDDNYLLEFTT